MKNQVECNKDRPLAVATVADNPNLSLDVGRLKHVNESVKQGEPVIIAQCPACAEKGSDSTGNHLIIYSDGRYGCVLYPAEEDQCQEHRRRIFALIGKNKPSRIRLSETRHPPRIKLIRVPKAVKEVPIRHTDAVRENVAPSDASRRKDD